MAKKSRKVFATTATAALVASAVAPIASSAAGYSDVTKPEYKTAIDALSDAGILNGYGNGLFKPENKVTREEVAKVITLIRHLGEGTKTPFKDVKDGYWSTQYINSLYAAKLVNGYEDGTFKPEGNVTRAEFAKLVVDAYGLKLTNAATPFTDVKAGNWATPYIQTAYANGLINGVSASKFDPGAPIKRGDLALLLYRADSKFGDVIGNNFPGVELVKATNNTTVEVTFKNAVDAKDVQASKFSIDGLTISNAAVKQTDSKTVVLTTSAQEGGKQYTVKSGSATLGKFIGASAVVPKSIKVTTPSVQGTIGKEVTLKAEVTVEDGKSKAGIPVTFNIVSKDSNLNSKIEVEVLTDENGVASYSYTRYYKHNDDVVAYATSKSDVSSNGKVYWAEALAIKEVTEGNSLANNAKKVYKVTGAANSTVNVAFKENVGVTPDKLERGARITDASVYSIKEDGKKVELVSTDANKFPYQTSTGGVQFALVKLNANGEATFTVTGSNAKVTPIVFADNTVINSLNELTSGNGKLDATELQAAAPTVEFSVQHTIGLDVKAEGTDKASYSTVAAGSKHAANNGGRSYKVSVTDNKGNKAPANTPVKVTFKDGNKSGNVSIYNANGDYVTPVNGVYSLVTNKDGEAQFTVINTTKDSYALPTVFVDNNNDGKLSTSDLQKDAEITYFGSAVINSASLTVTDKEGNEVKELLYNETAKVTFQPVDQNGFPYFNGVQGSNVTFDFTTTFGDISGVTANGVNLGTTNNSLQLATGADGKITFDVKTNRPTTLNISASGSGTILTPVGTTINFVGATAVLDRVNKATTPEKVLEALEADTSYADALSGLSSAEKLSVAKTILEKRPTGGYSAENLTSEFKTAVNSIKATKVTASAEYTAAVSAVTGAKATGTLAVNATDSITVTAPSNGTAFNGLTVKIVDAVKNNDKTTATYDSVKNSVTVELANNPVSKEVVSTIDDVVNAIKTVAQLDATFASTAATPTDPTATNAKGLVNEEIKLDGGVKEVTAQDASIVITFSEAVSATAGGTLGINVDNVGATTATQTLSADGKKLTFTFAADPGYTAASKVTAVTGVDIPQGKTLVTPIAISVK